MPPRQGKAVGSCVSKNVVEDHSPLGCGYAGKGEGNHENDSTFCMAGYVYVTTYGPDENRLRTHREFRRLLRLGRTLDRLAFVVRFGLA